MIYFTTVESPVDELLLLSDGECLTGLHMSDSTHAPVHADEWVPGDNLSIFRQVKQELSEYFAGKRFAFTVPLKPKGTDFQMSVWSELVKIPYGLTFNYGQLAEQVGNRNALRAVGLANGRNPIGIIVPCHRVIGANGKLTGYAGGLKRKHHLLTLEEKFDSKNGASKQQKLELLV